MSTTPFIYADSVSHTKINLMRKTENDELAEKLYKPYLINRSLSMFNDSILYANEMNMRPQLDNKQQYEYLLNTLRKRKRFSKSKWKKQEPDAAVEMIMEYFGYGRAKAEQAMRVLTDDQLTMIESALDKGGKG
jgi:hypothetical protein